MSVETFWFLVPAVGVAYWYWRKKKSNVTSTPERPAQAPSIQSPLGDPEETDPFLRAVTLEKERIDSAIVDAQNKHERELEISFSDDVKLKERLSNFAQEQQLDSALHDLWEEIRHYPSWPSSDDVNKWNKLHLARISVSKDGDNESVEFSHGGQRFKITERRWHGTKGARYSDVSLFEDSEEVFAISRSIHDEYQGDAYSCDAISAFKKHGNWPQVLLGCYAKIQIERNKLANRLRYLGAEEIKSRFEE